MNSDSTVGFVRSIYISAIAGDPMLKVPDVLAISMKGLEGDRYASQSGFWQTLPKPRETIRNVSFINASDVENSGFTEAETRRNIVVQTEINLVTLIDKHFYVGEVLFKGIEECTPCKRPSDLSTKIGFANVFKNKGGLRAQVLKSGRIRELDTITITQRSSNL
jgi:MOSC domain-containing protein YiiM